MAKQVLSMMILAILAVGTASAAYVPGPLPAGTFGGGTIPANADVFKDEQKAALYIAKFSADVAKCYVKGAKNVSRGLSDLVEPCIGVMAQPGAIGKYQSRIQSLSNLPACTNYNTLGLVSWPAFGSLQDNIYCASPSDSFLDGETSF